jgi:multimeric flavodoxin WrbA
MLVPKILGISGSLRGAEGNSDKMLREFMSYVERYGGESEIIRLTDTNILTCKGCASEKKDKLA